MSSITVYDEINLWEDRVVQWAKDRNLIEGSSPQAQFGKLLEEVQELYVADMKTDWDGVKDAIGDCCVVIRIMLAQLGRNWPAVEQPEFDHNDIADLIAATATIKEDFESETQYSYAIGVLYAIGVRNGFLLTECKERAWDDIKHRTGEMIDGVFVKDEPASTTILITDEDDGVSIDVTSTRDLLDEPTLQSQQMALAMMSTVVGCEDPTEVEDEVAVG